MKNPYDVLGVSTSAPDDQIKEAYRSLARKYQADLHASSPLSDIAAQRMKELDEAYDTIMNLRRTNAASTSASSATQGGYTAPGSAGAYARSGNFSDIRAKIADNRIDDAQTLLDGIPQEMRTAEWHFLKGTVLYRRGWFEEAQRYFNAACEMEPGNVEYRAAFNQINNSRSGGYRTGGSSAGGCSMCDICSGLMCLNCCCDGDCNPCC